MPSKNVDIVFVIDASGSMGPCFEKLCRNIGSLVGELESAAFQVKLGLVIHRMPNEECFAAIGLCSLKKIRMVEALYHEKFRNRSRDLLFTSDVTEFCKLLHLIEPEGDEDSLCALDFACDFPFGPLQNTQRVVILLSDETFETGLPGEESLEKLPDIIQKIHARNITLFAALPASPATAELSSANRADIEILENAYDGLENFDFHEFFKSLGKTISGSVAQLTAEPPYRKALFEQDQWCRAEPGLEVVEDRGIQ